jgi:hypothetical protein
VLKWLRFKRAGRTAHWNGNLSHLETAQLIERFLEGNELYPQEWNDFVEVPQRHKETDVYRQRCYDLDPLVNSHETPDPEALAELQSMVGTLHQKGKGADLGGS